MGQDGPGRFITLEGGEGTGKTTQARALAAHLETRGIDVLVTREPGGAPGAEEIRRLLVTGAADRWSAPAETLLVYAARDDHLRTTIRPALAAGRWVICDRFIDSTRAYQGIVGGVDAGLLDLLEQAVVGDTRPDLTIVLDVAPEAGLDRAAGREDAPGAPEDRFERKGAAFHAALRGAFLEIAETWPDRCLVVDTGRAVAAVSADIAAAVDRRFAGVE